MGDPKERDTFTLYELKEMYKNLLSLIESGAEESEFETALAVIDEPFAEKAEAYKVVMDRIQADIDMIKKEEERLSGKRRQMEGHVEKMKKSLFEAMKETKKDKIKSEHFTFSIRKNPPSVEVEDVKKLPEDYISVSVRADKKKIREALSSGKEVPGCSLIQSESLSIR